MFPPQLLRGHPTVVRGTPFFTIWKFKMAGNMHADVVEFSIWFWKISKEIQCQESVGLNLIELNRAIVSNLIDQNGPDKPWEEIKVKQGKILSGALWADFGKFVDKQGKISSLIKFVCDLWKYYSSFAQAEEVEKIVSRLTVKKIKKKYFPSKWELCGVIVSDSLLLLCINSILGSHRRGIKSLGSIQS